MAIIEIAKIQVRRGQEEITGLPQLDSGEFGWAVDTRKLYIGNGTLAEGAPELGNTEIITEHTVPNIFNLPSYSYTGHSPSPVNTDITRTVFSKLDDFVTVLDFGATGDGVTDDTPYIQKAIDQLFLNTDKGYEASRRTLYFPAGKYIVTSTIYVPPYANIVGDGPDKTKLEINTTTSTLMQFCDGSSLGNGGTYTVFVSGSSNITSLSKPKNINLKGVTFYYGTGTSTTSAQPLLRVDCAEDTVIDNCKFSGNYSSGLPASSNYVGIELRGQGAILTKNVKIKECIFSKVKLGLKSDYDIEDIVIENNKFGNLYQGILWANSVAANNVTGPMKTKITKNLFENIEYQGIFVGLGLNVNIPRGHVSSYNSFSQVGNNMSNNGDLNSASAIIEFQAPGNISIGDRFDRVHVVNLGGSDSTILSPIIKGRVDYTGVVSTATITTSASPLTFCRIPYTDSDQAINMQYIINKQSLGISRKGNLLISVSKVAPNPTVSVTENYSYVGSSSGDLTFTASLNTATNAIYVGYVSGNSFGTLEYFYRVLQ
jgi:Pectate lyase superfamily protein